MDGQSDRKSWLRAYKKHSNQLLLESDKDGFDESSFNNEVSVARSESLLGP